MKTALMFDDSEPQDDGWDVTTTVWRSLASALP